MSVQNGTRPIGVFDAGAGGLTVVSELTRQLPQESTLFLTDDLRVPYGTRPIGEIRQFTLECLDYLLSEGVKAMVIACNTASAAALEAAQARYDVPVIGVIAPTAHVAAQVARTRVGIIGTDATVNSQEYVRAIRALAPEIEVHQQAAPLLAGLIEAGQANSKSTVVILEEYLTPLTDRSIDTLILGCTHYPLSRPSIEKVIGPAVQIVESGPCTVASLLELMTQGLIERAGGLDIPYHRLLTTGDDRKVWTVASALWPGESPSVEVVKLGW